MKRMLMAALLTLSACGQSSTEGAGPVQDAPAAAPTSSGAWDRDLLFLLPAIDACISRSPATRTVSYAGVHNARDALLIRLQGSERAIDCHLSGRGDIATMLVEIIPREESLVVAGENAAIFVRAPGENPGGECYEAPEVRDADGALLGWTLDPEGC